jgi:hypothetical protein
METEIERKRRLFAEMAPKYDGALAVYTDNPAATCVKVSYITYDDWGMKLRIDRVAKAGMGPLRSGKECCAISATWETLFSCPKEWYAAYCPWRLLFDPPLVAAFEALANKTAAEGKVVDHAATVKCIRENYRRY